jgi:hypothetical protein
MRPTLPAFALLALLVQNANAASALDMTLPLPHPLGAGETAWIEVKVGPISRGQEINVTTAPGQELGVISPFGMRFGQEAGIYTLPVPADAIPGRPCWRSTDDHPVRWAAAARSHRTRGA